MLKTMCALALPLIMLPLASGPAPADDTSSVDRLVAVIASVGASSSRKAEAADALIPFGAKAVPPLLKVLSTPDSAGSWLYAVTTLGCLRSTEAIQPLGRILRDRSYGPRRFAAIALGQIGDTRAVSTLERALKDAAFVREDALSALKEIDSPAARTALARDLLGRADPRWKLRVTCVPPRVAVGGRFRVDAVLENASGQPLPIRLVGGVPECTPVVTTAGGTYLLYTKALIEDREPEATVMKLVKPGALVKWSVAGIAQPVLSPPAGCPPRGPRRMRDAVVLSTKAFLIPSKRDLRIRLVIREDATPGPAGPGTRGTRGNPTAIVSGAASLTVL